MLFRKKIDRMCIYCQRAGQIDEDHVICPYTGVVSADGSCRRFRYDPLKRIPSRAKPKDFASVEHDDFSL